jgi:hypothetical protein
MTGLLSVKILLKGIVRSENIDLRNRVWFADPKIKVVLVFKTTRSKIGPYLVSGYSSYLLRKEFAKPSLGEGDCWASPGG